MRIKHGDWMAGAVGRHGVGPLLVVLGIPPDGVIRDANEKPTVRFWWAEVSGLKRPPARWTRKGRFAG